MKEVKIAYIGNYVPRRCGIATFTRDIVNSLATACKDKNIKAETYVLVMDDQDQTLSYPEEVNFIIRQEHKEDYLKAVEFINYSDADICILQHEFGIFGGDYGVYILSLVRRLKIPLIVTFHTVLKDPNYSQKVILEKIGDKAAKIAVMSEKSIDFLTKIYGLTRKKIVLIEHGVPDFNFTDREHFKKKLNLDGKKTLLTFGLLSRNKGIDTVIKAMPRIVDRYPELLYIILGKTHPHVVKHTGEEYRNYLKLLVEKNNLRKHVFFNDRYVSNEELFSYLSAVDIYITPYINEVQIASGTLAYAAAAGAAIVSTPYWHAVELLGDGRGRLFDFGDSASLAKIINELLENPSILENLRKKAYSYGRKTIWPIIGHKYLEIIYNTIKSHRKIDINNDELFFNPLDLPKFELAHMKRLTDSTGIIQHATYSVPNLKEGYCLDDNARALLVCAMAYRQEKSRDTLELMSRYLSYIHYMQNDDGSFRNSLSYKKVFLDQIGSEDSFGRTSWALGYFIRYAPNDGYFQVALEMFTKAIPHFINLKSIRGTANTIIGICHYNRRFPGDEGMVKILNQLTHRIGECYKKENEGDWNWFESVLTYDNAIIPLALFHAFEITYDEKLLSLAKVSMEFLDRITLSGGYLSLVGNKKWYKKGGERSKFDQQPIDAAASVLMFFKAFEATGDKKYIKKMKTAFMWFLGENELGIPLYDFETFGCCDGLEISRVNTNQGAESCLSYLLAHLTLLLAYK
jgi:glycosyltransferase involved in cell wall biosynthesis